MLFCFFHLLESIKCSFSFFVKLGDLGIGLACAYPEKRVIVYEPNRQSYEAGMRRSIELKIKNIAWKNDTVQSLVNQISSRKDITSILVISLHACGGLSDFILENCGILKIPFCICTCCFASFPSLRSKKLLGDEHNFKQIAKIAETDNLPEKTQNNATRVINNARIRTYFKHGAHKQWQCTSYRFPKSWSARNFILCGERI